jgi:hypothetical protein
MARTPISKKDGSTTPYFWSDRDGTQQDRKSVYKQTPDGVKRMKGIRFNTVSNRIRRD